MAEDIEKRDKLEKFHLIKEDGFNYRKRRHDSWDINYRLYRDTVITNRITQRQSVNIPLMKQTIRTLLKDVDDMPVLYFENLDNNKDAEIFKNEYWKFTQNKNRMDLQDIVDKKQVFLFGRTFDSWQIVNGVIRQTIQDPMDIAVSRFMDPTDINTSRYLVHSNIFVPLSSMENNPLYDQDAVRELIMWFATEQGLIKSSENEEMWIARQQKLADLGLEDAFDPVLGETYVELTMYKIFETDAILDSPDGKRKIEGEQIIETIIAEDKYIVSEKPQEEVFGETKDHYWQDHYNYQSWADDLERQDFWSDSVADIVRTPNMVVNSWFSSLVENRTLRNLNMHYYNSNLTGFVPQSWTPRAWGWYGIPIPKGEKLQDHIMDVAPADLSESLDELTFVLNVVEKATGATATQQGVQSDRKVTLGEIQLALTEAKARVKGMSKFYTPAWERRGEIFYKLIEGSADKLDVIDVSRKGRNTSNMYTRTIGPADWMTKSGYVCKVWTQDEKDVEDVNKIQKLQGLKQLMPNNPKVAEVVDRKYLEWCDLSPTEINDIMQVQVEQRTQMMNTIMSGAVGNVSGGQNTAQQFRQPAPVQTQTPVRK